MADAKSDNKTTLFFVKNPNHQFGPIESFLKKRGYHVVVEADPNIALEMLLETNPEYIFLAWDHKVDSIRTMPKNIYQSCTGQIVPFINSTQREQIIQLESSGFENRLYPPLSGPAIMRLISKFEKQNQIFDQISRPTSTTSAKKESEMIQVKSFFTADDEQKSEFNVRSSTPLGEPDQKLTATRNRNQAQMFAHNQAKQKRPLSIIAQGGHKAKLMSAMSTEVDNTPTLAAEQKSTVKNNLMSAVEKEFSNSGTNSSLKLAIQNEIDQIANYPAEQQAELQARLLALIDTEMDNTFPDLTSDVAGSETTSSQLSKEAKKLSQGQVASLGKSFDESIKPEMFDLIESYADLNQEKTTLNETTQIYVLAIQELEWTGYLTVASESHLDVNSAQVILNNWIKQTIRMGKEQSEEAPDSVLFEMHVPKVNYADFCSYKSEFFKDVDYEDKKTMIGFFSFSPYQVINSIHKSFDMLELSTTFLQPNKNLPFDINLYLAENKKFITYLRPGSFLDDAQVSRLQTRKVEYIYSGMDYDQALLKYKAEFNLNNLIQEYHRLKGNI